MNTLELKYPKARIDNVVDNYHGIQIKDPYRWLEDSASHDTQNWVKDQTKLTRKFLNTTDTKEKLTKRITQIWNYPKYSVPVKRESRLFWAQNNGLENHYSIYMQKSPNDSPVVILDPNNFSDDGTVALNSFNASKDGRFVAYGISSGGSDWQKIKIKDIDNDKDYDDLLKWCKFTSIAWKENNEGFYYSRFPHPGMVAKEDINNYNRLYYHRLGTDQDKDILIYEDPDNKELRYSPQITEDGRYLLLKVWHGCSSKNCIYYKELKPKSSFVKLLDKMDAGYTFIDNDGSIFYFLTDLDSPRGRIVAIDINKPENIREIIPQTDSVIDFVTIVNNHLVLAYMRDVVHVLKIYDMKGNFKKELDLPAIGSVIGLNGKRKDTEMFIGLTSYLFPTTIFKYDLIQDKTDVIHEAKINFEPSAYETKQIFYTSKDGTKVPMFITHKKDIPMDGNNPVILYGYGGFNHNVVPAFSVSMLVWLENGGIYAAANIRGGNEYGEDWHQAGILDKKQNVFDDFISAAEWMVDNKYTNPDRIAINGGSNGGLLVASCMLQRPDLFGAIICKVPVIDMLRYHKFTVGHYWIPEYGNPDDPEHFKFLYEYSPLHNIRRNTKYPPVMVCSADTDDRVVPAHSKKFVATLQDADNPGQNIILLRFDTKAGHGQGKPTSKLIDEQADIFTFLFKVFGMNF